LIPAYANYRILGYRGLAYSQAEAVPTSTVALVFGAGLRRDGTPSDVLRDRIDSAIELYSAKKVRKLVMTGDNGSADYDEVSAMKAYAVDQGVPEGDIVLDYAGFRTYDSCYRAREVFGLWDIVAVSQEFHLPRILFTCNSLRVHAVGYRADKHNYVRESSWALREFAARTQSWVEVVITHPRPKFLGRKEDVF